MSSSRRSDIAFAVSLVGVLLIAYYLRHALLLIYVSILFAIVLTPPVQFIHKLSIGRWHPGKGLSILFLLITLLASFGLFVGIVIPPIVRDVQEFASDLPARVPDMMDRLRSLPALNRLAPQDLQEQLTALAARLPRLLTGIAGGLLGFFTWLILTIYFVLDGRRTVNWGLRLLPSQTAAGLKPVLLHARDRVRRWMLGQLLLMLILGLLSTAAYNLMGIRYATGLGVFTGLANIVPIIGPVASVLLASVAGALDSWMKALGVLAFYAIYQQLENGFLTPRIMKATVELPALAVVVALLIGGELAGLLGGLVAVPSAALIAVFVDEYLVQLPTSANSKAAE
jgi:predicted PurR-regulated permease PerM